MSHSLHVLSSGFLALLLLLPLIGVGCAASAPGDSLKVGERAPDFHIPSTVAIPAGSGTVSIGAITSTGRSVVLAFFPKAFTGG